MQQELLVPSAWNFTRGGGGGFSPSAANKKKRKLSDSDDDDDDGLFGISGNYIGAGGMNAFLLPNAHPLGTSPFIQEGPELDEYLPQDSDDISQGEEEEQILASQQTLPLMYTTPDRNQHLRNISPVLPAARDGFEIIIEPPATATTTTTTNTTHRRSSQARGGKFKTLGGIVAFALVLAIVSITCIDYKTELSVLERGLIDGQHSRPDLRAHAPPHTDNMPLEGNPQYEESRNSRLEVREKKMLIYGGNQEGAITNRISPFPVRQPHSVFTYNEDSIIARPSTDALTIREKGNESNPGGNPHTRGEGGGDDDDCVTEKTPVHSSYRFELLPHTFTNRWALYPTDVNSDGVPRLHIKQLLEFKVCCWTTVGEFQCSSSGSVQGGGNSNGGDHHPFNTFPLFATIVENHESGANFVKIKFTDEAFSSKRCVLSFVSEVCV